MEEVKSLIREYEESDYMACECLVSEAWEFDKNFSPQEMADLGKYLYTMGSLSASNFSKVVEVGNEVVGFLFGHNEKDPVPKHDMQKLSSRMRILRRLLFMRGVKLKEKINFMNSISTHEVNRTALVGRGRSEIVLFVVNPAYQGKGYGKRLFAEFTSFCAKSDVESIVVETNKLGASSFYEHIGFKHLGNFSSPLHSYATRNGQACMYEYSL